MAADEEVARKWKKQGEEEEKKQTDGGRSFTTTTTTALKRLQNGILVYSNKEPQISDQAIE